MLSIMSDESLCVPRCHHDFLPDSGYALNNPRCLCDISYAFAVRAVNDCRSPFTALFIFRCCSTVRFSDRPIERKMSATRTRADSSGDFFAMRFISRTLSSIGVLRSGRSARRLSSATNLANNHFARNVLAILA